MSQSARAGGFSLATASARDPCSIRYGRGRIFHPRNSAPHMFHPRRFIPAKTDPREFCSPRRLIPCVLCEFWSWKSSEVTWVPQVMKSPHEYLKNHQKLSHEYPKNNLVTHFSKPLRGMLATEIVVGKGMHVIVKRHWLRLCCQICTALVPSCPAPRAGEFFAWEWMSKAKLF